LEPQNKGFFTYQRLFIPGIGNNHKMGLIIFETKRQSSAFEILLLEPDSWGVSEKLGKFYLYPLQRKRISWKNK